MANKPVLARVALVDQVRAVLMERILDRAYAPGAKLNIDALSREFEVSSSPKWGASTAYWLERLERQDRLYAPACQLAEALDDEQTRVNGMILEADGPTERVRASILRRGLSDDRSFAEVTRSAVS